MKDVTSMAAARSHDDLPRTTALPTGLPVQHVRLRPLQTIVPYTNMHLHRLEKAGKFPKRIRLGPGRVVWNLSEVLAWVEARRAESVSSI
jgi:predicted DNA-binding transcriptional regulator AlpA